VSGLEASSPQNTDGDGDIGDESDSHITRQSVRMLHMEAIHGRYF
jgi:hypothetical protein